MDSGDVVGSDGGGSDLSDDEVRAAIGSLTDTEVLRLMVAEGRYRAGTDYGKGDLLHAAFCQALMRERRCPRNIGFVRTLAMMMRSTGGHRRRLLERQVSFDAPVLRSSSGGAAVAPADTLAAGEADPEQALIQGEGPDVIDAMLSTFQGDEEAQYVIMGIAEGLKGAALQEATGLSSNQVHYVLRKIRKRLGPDRKGWLA